MKSKYGDTSNIAGACRLGADSGVTTKALWRAASALAMLIATLQALATNEAQAQQRIALANSTHTATVTVNVGKSEDVHTDQSLVDIAVGNPDVADANPLTDHALSILGKKIGTTRVTVYGEGRKTVGIFDVEVSLDVSRLNVEIARLTGGGVRVSSVNGHILLSGTAPDAVTLDKVVTIARQFVPDVINTVQVMQPQQIMLEVRFIEASRQASRELGFQWNLFGGGTVANIGNQVSASQLPLTNSAVGSAVAAGVLSGAPPFGFLVSQLVGGKNPLNVAVNALEQKGLARSLAEPNLVALSGDTASFLAGGQFYVPVPGALGVVTFAPQSYGVGLSFTPTVLKDGLINLVIKPEVSQIDPNNSVTVAGTSVPALIVRKASTTLELRVPELHARRPVGEHQQHHPGPVALGWRRASAGCSVPQQPVPEERDRSGDPGDAAYRPAIVAERCGPYAARQHLTGKRHRLFPDGPGRGQPGTGAPRNRRAEPTLCRPHPRPAEERGDLCVGQLNASRAR